MPTEAQVLSHLMDRAREWTLYYLSPLKGADPHRVFTCEGKPFNSLFWLVAHLATSENGLLLAATQGPFEKFWWAKHFTVGASGLPPEECPPFQEVWDKFKAVHQKAVNHIATLDDAALALPNPTKLPIGATVHDVVSHAIRHEGGHAGQIAWLCKLYGAKMI